jgi:hypothetical protein
MGGGWRLCGIGCGSEFLVFMTNFQLFTKHLPTYPLAKVGHTPGPSQANLVGVWACCGEGDRKSRRDAMIIDKRRLNGQNLEGVTENNATPSGF